MKKFDGFPARMEFTAIPNVFFSGLLPAIDDMAELKTTLHVMALLYRKKGYPRYIRLAELLEDAALMEGLRSGPDSPEAALRRGLEMAAGRGTLLRLALEGDGAAEEIYFLNDKAGRQAVSRIKNGQIVLTGLKVKAEAYIEPAEAPNIYRLYEDNIGILDPMISEQLRDAEKTYPEKWIRDAFQEAVNQGVHKWSYISAILARWATEGKTDGTHQRDSEKTDPDKYIKGKYGHMVQR
jgi:DNA replication protein